MNQEIYKGAGEKTIFKSHLANKYGDVLAKDTPLCSNSLPTKDELIG